MSPCSILHVIYCFSHVREPACDIPDILGRYLSIGADIERHGSLALYSMSGHVGEALL